MIHRLYFLCILAFPYSHASSSFKLSSTTSRTLAPVAPISISHVHGPEGDSSKFDALDADRVIGIALGVPFSIFALAGVISLTPSVHQQHQRREMIQPTGTPGCLAQPMRMCRAREGRGIPDAVYVGMDTEH